MLKILEMFKVQFQHLFQKIVQYLPQMMQEFNFKKLTLHQVKGSVDGSRHGRSFGASHRAYDKVRPQIGR